MSADPAPPPPPSSWSAAAAATARLALLPLVGMPSWLLDGIFIGATAGRALRVAAVVATVLYLALDTALRPLGNLGVWLAFTASYLFRAGALGWHWPALLRSLDPAGEVAPGEKRG